MSQYSINSIPELNYFVRPVKKEDRLAILQLLLNKKNKLFFWISLKSLLFLMIFCIILAIYSFITLAFIPAWQHMQTYGLELDFLSYFFISGMLFFCPVLLIISQAISFNQELNNGYVAVSNNKILGFVSLTKYCGRYYLCYLSVNPRYRKKGIGSCLIQEIIKRTNKPIYVFVHSYPHLLGFFSRLGFKQRNYRVFLFWRRKDRYHLGYEKMDILGN